MKQKYECLEKPPQSLWLTPADQPAYPKLEGERQTDVAIVGGGMAGITLAWLLAKEGVGTVLLEADRILFGTTGHTTAKITSQHDLIYDKLVKAVGNEQARQYATANEQAIAEIAGTVRGLGVDCDFERQPAYVFTERDENIAKINAEVEAASQLGIKAEYADRLPLGFPVKAAVRFDGQAQFHPRKYLLALARHAVEKGCAIFEQSRIVDLEQEGDGYTLTMGEEGRVRARKVVIASHYPFYNKAGLYFARLYVERSYIIAARTRETFPGGMYINAEEPARSLRSQAFEGGRLTLVVGETHKCGQSPDTQQHYRALVDYAGEHFTVESIPFRWSAQDCMTLDGIPYAGHFTSDTPDLYVATGFGKWGMTNSTASAMLIRDLIVHGRSDWQEVYSPSRLNLVASAKNVVVENANVAANLLAGKLEPLPDDVDIAPGEAKIVDVDGHRAGAYRDGRGELHVVDTTCPHMGCEVNWNTAEKSWDCPCHGSRFDVDGNVIEGPALRALNSGKSVNTLEKLVKDEY